MSLTPPSPNIKFFLSFNSLSYFTTSLWVPKKKIRILISNWYTYSYWKYFLQNEFIILLRFNNSRLLTLLFIHFREKVLFVSSSTPLMITSSMPEVIKQNEIYSFWTHPDHSSLFISCFNFLSVCLYLYPCLSLCLCLVFSRSRDSCARKTNLGSVYITLS